MFQLDVIGERQLMIVVRDNNLNENQSNTASNVRDEKGADEKLAKVLPVALLLLTRSS